MWNVFGIAVLLSSFLLVAQAETQDKAQFQEEESVSRGAVIYFYRMKSFTDSMRNPTLYTRGRPLVKLEKNRFFALPVPAGTHYFSWSEQPKKGEEAWVTVNPDQMVFFKVRWREIVPVSEASATRDMRNLAAVESKDIFDSTVERTAPAEMRVALQRRLVVQEVDENISSSERERAELDFDSVRQNPALPRPPAGLEDSPLTLDQLLALLEADIAEELILDKIALSGCQCDTAAAAIITLKGAGASDELIRQIIVGRIEASRPSRADKEASNYQIQQAISSGVQGKVQSLSCTASSSLGDLYRYSDYLDYKVTWMSNLGQISAAAKQANDNYQSYTVEDVDPGFYLSSLILVIAPSGKMSEIMNAGEIKHVVMRRRKTKREEVIQPLEVEISSADYGNLLGANFSANIASARFDPTQVLDLASRGDLEAIIITSKGEKRCWVDNYKLIPMF